MKQSSRKGTVATAGNTDVPNIKTQAGSQPRLDDSRFRLAAIVDSAEDAIISKTLNSIICTWNDGANRMFGYTAEEIVGKSILTLIPPELHHEEDEILAKIRAGQRIEHYETTRLRKDGQPIQISVTISPIRDDAGHIVGASKIARDISDRKRLERLLVESEKIAAAGRMAASIAHEINNPLESVLNLIYLARQESDEGSKIHEYLLTAEEEIERVSHIARQTLGYYRDTGEPVPVCLDDLMQNVLTVYRAKLIQYGITVQTHFERPIEIAVLKGEILQVFSNIVANALDAMRSGGILRVTVCPTDRSGTHGIATVVEDNGSGIPPDVAERIFEPFFTTKRDVGNGVGLWVARQLVEKRGGSIEISSSVERRDHGTKVNIFIPFSEPAEQTL